MPSECYENNPLAVIESLSMGTPVLGAETGGIPELISENINGYLFSSGNQLDLIEKIKFFWGDGIRKIDVDEIARQARKRFSSQVYYEKLMEVYKSAQKI